MSTNGLRVLGSVAGIVVAGLAAVAGCGGLDTPGEVSTAVRAVGVVHSVTGSGLVPVGPEHPVEFRQTIAAHSDAAGNAWGQMVVAIDLTPFELGMIRLSGKVDCLEVGGKEAWIGGVATHSSDPGIIPVGVPLQAWVHDLGGNGDDRMHAEIFPADCHQRPALPDTGAIPGNFTVQ